ncbi:MAG: hypothetical protein J6A89_01695 [Clostridia bacterium]|nr:hypothetical protein [Clostridia bacterium]
MSLKIVIADNCIKNIKFIMNRIINNVEEINIKSYIATTEEEVLKTVSENEINAILVNPKSIDTTNIKEIDVITIEESINEKQIMDNLISINERLINGADIKNINKKVIFELSNLGYNFKLKGTQYIVETIMYIYKSQSVELLENLEENVYKVIAIKNNKSLNNIKTNIIKSTKFVDTYQNKNILYKYFSLDIKITPKLVISTILNKIIL